MRVEEYLNKLSLKSFVKIMVSIEVSGIIVFSVGLWLSFYQPLLVLLDKSQMEFVVILWVGYVLFIVVSLAKNIKKAYGINRSC